MLVNVFHFQQQGQEIDLSCLQKYYNFLYLQLTNNRNHMFDGNLSSSYLKKQNTLFRMQTPQHVLHQDVARMNFDVIKGLLPKIADIYSRLEDFDEKCLDINKKLQKNSQQYENFHHQFRMNFLISEKKNDELYNDILNIKNKIGVPDTTMSPEEYLNSYFFKQQSKNLNVRSRKNIKRGCKKHKTNFTESQKISMKNSLPSSKNISNDTKKNMESELNHQIIDKISSSPPKSQHTSSQQILDGDQRNKYIDFESDDFLLQRIKKMQEQKQLIKKQIQQNEGRLRRQLQNKIKQNDNRLSDYIKRVSDSTSHQYVDYSAQSISLLIGYIEDKLPLKFKQTISITQFQQSLRNLKDAWQIQSIQIFRQLMQKISIQDLIPFQQRLKTIQSKILDHNGYAPAKISRITFKSNNQLKNNGHHKMRSYMDREFEAMPQKDTNRQFRQTLAYSNSTSRLQGGLNENNGKDQIPILGYEDEKKWKQNVINILRDGKIARKCRHS